MHKALNVTIDDKRIHCVHKMFVLNVYVFDEVRFFWILEANSWFELFGTRVSTITFILKLNSVAFSPQTNYTDWATAACRRS
jgi:hypothetical protein